MNFLFVRGPLCFDAMWSCAVHPENVDDTFFRNVGNHLKGHTASQPRSPLTIDIFTAVKASSLKNILFYSFV
jgi:hypothetical protein